MSMDGHLIALNSITILYTCINMYLEKATFIVRLTATALFIISSKERYIVSYTSCMFIWTHVSFFGVSTSQIDHTHNTRNGKSSTVLYT
ncbi:hypothetical protein B0O99DRAFT_620479 [Bisporella sp. PMI_857]|nr:hypothetical protein B0O99DRAFT_620479 [Bisporella sp. PMI_857]